MAEDRHRYYIAAGAELEIAKAFFDERAKVVESARAIEAKYGGRLMQRGHFMVGMTFDGEPPKGWRRSMGKAYCVPDKRAAIGKEAASDLKSFRDLDAADLAARFADCPQSLQMDRGQHRFPYVAAETFGEDVVLRVPEWLDWTPAESRQIKDSEYWAMREAKAA